MTSPAMMRLMGLLVIVGMVAACGSESPAPSADGESPVAALTMDDVVALRHEQSRLLSSITDFRNPDTPDPWRHPNAQSLCARAQHNVMLVGPYAGMMENAVNRGDDLAARTWRRKAIAELELAREKYAQARAKWPR